jgi:RNA exonuclease 4
VDSIPHDVQLLSETLKKKRNRTSVGSVQSTDTTSVSSLDTCDKPQVKKDSKKKCRGKKTKKPSLPLKKGPRITEEEKEKYVAVDCEMVGVGPYGNLSSLARVCMVDWYGNCILDIYVRQTSEVTDYRTFVSGIKEEDLTSDRAVDLDECRSRVEELIEGKILVGHALKNDLHALQICHPWYNLRDTGKYEPFMKVRFDDGILWPRKLKDLAKEKLGKEMQEIGKPHCPFEDARTALELYKKVRGKWEKAMEYKMRKTMEIQRLHMSVSQ